jgi:hypothetical protein
MMHTIKDPIRAGRRYWAMLLLSLLCFTTAWAQTPTLPAVPTACDYTTEPATIALTAQNVPAGYSTVYLLVNMTSGLIVQTNATAPTFTGVSRGLYYAVAAHYTGTLQNAQSGKLISDVVSVNQCLTYGPTLGLKVCAPAGSCDYAVAPASVTFTANSVPSGVETSYVLVDEATNLIVQVSPSTFGNVPVGDYAITSVHYTGSLTALVAGSSLYSVTTQNRDGGPANCLSVSNTIHIRVCNSPIAITGPPNGGIVASTNPLISGTSTPNASVTVTGGPGSSGGPCITTANASGAWTCPSLTFTAGPQSVTATNGSTSAVSTFTVTPALTTAATPVTLTTPQNTSATLNMATVLNPSGGTGSLTYSVFDPVANNTPGTSTPTQHGTVTINPTTGVLTYTPTPGFVGTDAVVVRVCDSNSPTPVCVQRTVPITILPVSTSCNLPDTIISK